MKQQVGDAGTVARNDRSRTWNGARHAIAALLASVAMSVAAPVFAQTSVLNTAQVVNPDGLACSDVATNPTCLRSDDALVTVTPVQPNFGSCDATMYLAQNTPTGLFEFDTGNNPFDVNPVGPTASITYNAIAYNPVDNYIYGLRGPAPGTLVRIGSDGSVEDVGTVANLPNTSIMGEIAPDGAYYVGAGFTLYRIDIPTRTATAIALNRSLNGADLAWHDGRLYTAVSGGGDLLEIDPVTGNVVALGATGVSGGFGGMFGASNGVFGSNNSGGFYQFDLATGQATLISDLPGSGNNDGAKCATTPLEFPADLSITKDDGSDEYMPGEDVVYTIVASNLGPFGVSGATVSDPLPVGITDASWTCVTGVNGGSCGIASGSGAIGVPVNLPADATVVFTLTMSVPGDFSGDLVNTATVTEPAAGSPDPTPGNNTATDTDIASTVVTVDKRVAPGSGTPVSVGDTLAYTLAVTVANGPTTVDEVLVDTLGAGLTVGTLPAGCVAAGQVVTCTLPAGAAIGEHLFEYTATVGADATTSVSNSVVPSSGTCVSCTTTNPVDPTITVNKSVDPANGTAVSVGDTLTYTLSVNVANAVSTDPEVLVDTLGAGLTAGTLPASCTAAGQVITCTLPAGAAIGEHLFEYTATVDADAVTSVSNSVVPSSGTCLTCTTSNPLTPEITVSKTVDPASGTTVSVGDTLTYTLSVNVANAVTTAPEVLVDTLGTGLTVGTLPTDCTAAGQVITCALAAGAAIGEHLFEYTATVGADATTSVSNSVVPSSGACLTCTTTNPIAPTITVTKNVNPVSGTAVSVGDTLTYTLSVNVANAATTDAEVLIDTLGAGLTLGTLPADCTASGQVVTCTLPAGSAIGDHLFEYTATVDADATMSVSNSVVPSSGTCLTCTTTNPIDPTITVTKSVDPASGTAVSVGDTLTYTLSVNVANAATTDAEVLVDTLGAGLTAGTLPADCTAAGQVVTCTLPAGAAIGEHLFEYTATVDADATTSVSNSVVPSSGTCVTCTTTNPVDPTITVNKTVDPGNGTAVSVGDTLTYTLSVNVANAATTDAEVLIDTLGAGLTVGTVPAGCTASGQIVTCTLATGAAIGEHLFEYTATVDADAVTSVSNSVVPSSGACLTCTTINPVDPTITVNKTVDPGNGTAVSVGDTLAYTLSITVFNAVTNDPEVLVDTLGAGLTVGTLPAGCTAAGQVVTCTLPAGAAIGEHLFEYTATVDADATTSVSNSVVPSSGTCVTCTTTNPVEPTVTVNKTVDPGNGTAVSVGDTLTYTLSVNVANAVTTDPEVLVDTLGAGLTAGTLPASCTAAGQVITCTLPAGAAIGEHLFEYTATVDADATTSVSNSVVPSSGTCLACTTTNPVDPTVTVSKTVDPGNGTAVSVGDTLAYTLAVTVANAVTVDAEVLVDTLGAGLTVGTLPAGCTAAGQEITCTLAAGAAIGEHLFEYTATVGADATTSVSNSVVPSTGACVTCTTTNPVDPTITVNKTVDPGTGTAVSVGDTLAYTLAVTVANAVTVDAEVLVDTLGVGLTVGTLPAGCTAAGQVITCTLAAGSAIGEHLFEYTATVGADATTTVSNSVVPSSGSCVTCTTSNPLTPEITVDKTVDPASGTAVWVGDTLAYTLTVTVANAATTAPEVLVDTLGTGLAIDTLPAGCSASGQVVTCTLASGSAIGSYPFEYTATVGADATTSVSNSVVPSSGTCVSCTTTNPVEPTVTVNKTVDPGNGTAVSVGDTLAYTLSVNVANAVTTEPEVLVDTLGAGLTVGTLPAGCTASGQVITCTLGTGAAIGEHLFEYTATVGADATTTVSNSVVPSSGNCLSCTTTNPLTPEITVSKTVDPANGTAVSVGDTLTYTLSVNVANAATTDAEVLVDTLGTGLTVGTLPAGCVATGQVITCTLTSGSAIDTYLFEYTATVGANATTSVNNSVVPSSGTCVGCVTTNPVEPTVTVNKTVDPGNGTAVSVGDTLAYTLSVSVANAVTTDAEVLVDTLGAGLSVGTLPAGCTAAGQVITCTLAAGAAIGEHLFEYTATVDADATTSVSNSVVPSSGTCVTCTTTNPVDPTITVNKTVDPGNGTAVSVGDTLTYTLSVNVANAVTIDPEVLVDTLGAGLTAGTLPAGCTAAGQVITCTLAAGAAIGEHLFEYTATVDADATTTVSNSVVPSSGTCLTCTTSNPLTPEITVSKTVDPASGTAVSVGDTLTYTLSVNVANAVTTDPEVLVDTLGTGLIVDTLPAGCTASGQVLTCTLPAGAAIGEHLFEYTATVGTDATTSVSNSVVPSSGTCVSCTTSNPVVPRVSVSKSSDPASGERVKANDEVTYTVSVTVANSATTEAIILTDTFSGAQALLADSIVAPAGGSCAPSPTGLVCTLAAGAAPGVHDFAYRTRVAAGASGSIGNQVVPAGGGGAPPDCASCATEHEIAQPVVNVTKSADPGSNAELHVGDTIAYTLTVTVADAATTSELVLDDTPGPGLTIGALPAGCAATGTGLRCLLPSGSIPGSYAFSYPATVNPDAGETVRNAVLANGGGGEQNPPNCLACETSHRVLDTAQLRIVKAASVRETRLGELVRYTLTVENVGATNVRGAEIVDTPAAGFSYVDDSLAVVDGDNAATVAGYNPIRFGGLDIDAGQSATLVYLMRVGAGVRPGVLVNQAQAFPGGGGDPISNIATAEVMLASDPLIDESLILGTVFDDRDGDGWQDSAAMSGVHVQGGFDPAAYLPGSTTVDRGDGAKPEPDASAPLLHGIEVGAIGARQSIADPVARRQVVIRQRLRDARFTDDFVLTTDQGATLRMDAAGNTTVERTGEAAKGLNGAEPTVTRRVAQGEGGVVVDYVIGNAGVDERGVPGVRIASVDGLLMETDQFGRYHLAGVPGGPWERGRNFILKVDPSTLPPGTEITTDNPLLRRITPGLPVRFDFGARMPVEQIKGGERQVELELGEVVFEPGSAQVRAQYAPVLEQVAARVAEYQGGEVVIHADGDSEGLAFGRASAVKEALLAKLPADVAQALVVSVRTRVDDPSTLVAGATEGGALLGTVLFDTDRATIRPQYDELLGKVAAWLEQQGGGSVAIVGHADPRGSDDYNVALGMRRARAVFDAIAARLSPAVRGNVRVESSSDPAAPAGNSGKQGDGP